MTIHVAHVITKLDVGGAQTHLVELASGQHAAGYRVDVVAGVGGAAAERLVNAGVSVRIEPALGSAYGRLAQRRAVSAVGHVLAAIGPGLVHGHSSNGGLAARLAARRLGLPSVYTAHGWPFQKGARWQQRALSLVGEFVGGHVGDAVIVLTGAELARAARARVVPRSRLWVVPNGISDVPSGLRRVPSRRGDPKRLVMVARFAPPKMQNELVTVLAELTDLEWTMQFVGDGPELEACCAAAARHPGLAGRIEFLGHRDDVAAVLAANDIGILWSRYEGLPISVMEYMRTGLCCVGRDLPGVRELLGYGSGSACGIVAGSPGALAAALRRLLAAPGLADEFGGAARKRYVEHFSAHAMVAATAEVYDAITGRTLQRS